MIISFEINLGLSTWDEVYSAIEAEISEGFEIIDIATYQHDGEPIQRFTLRKPDAVATVDANKLQVRSITQVERKETYSKTAKKNFSFWACTLENGERVNVFDHPDPERNTWKIAQGQGWDEWTTLGEGVTEFYDITIPCVVSSDGKWYSLVNIMTKNDYDLLNPPVVYDIPDEEIVHLDEEFSNSDETESIEADSDVVGGA